MLMVVAGTMFYFVSLLPLCVLIISLFVDVLDLSNTSVSLANIWPSWRQVLDRTARSLPGVIFYV